MRLQCPQCFAINSLEPDDLGEGMGCGRCGRILEVPEARLAPNLFVGDYVIRKVLRRGTEATDVLAYQVSLDRPVVLKIVEGEAAQNENYVNRFLNVGRTVAQLNHPSICQYYDAKRDGDMFYLVREAVELETLRERLARDTLLPIPQALRVARNVAEALDYAWLRRSLLHANVKPDYVFLSRNGNAKLADIGLAQLDPEDDPENPVPEEEQVFKGTPQFVAPERIYGGSLDPRSDVYSLGVTFFLCLCGELPYQHEDSYEVLNMHLEAPIPDVRDRRQGISEDIARVIHKMLAKDPNDRYPNSAFVVEDLQSIERGQSPRYCRAGGSATAGSRAPAAEPAPAVKMAQAEPGPAVSPPLEKTVIVNEAEPDHDDPPAEPDEPPAPPYPDDTRPVPGAETTANPTRSRKAGQPRPQPAGPKTQSIKKVRRSGDKPTKKTRTFRRTGRA